MAVHSQADPIRIGFVPQIDCAPLVLAHELGMFRERGLNVELVREPGWASIRDKLVYGQLEGAHALGGFGLAVSWGVGVLARPCMTGFMFSVPGVTLRLARAFLERGVRDVASLVNWIRKRSRPPSFAIPHRFSTEHFLLRQWLGTHGLLAGRDYALAILPPSQMRASLEAGFVEGFCIGEPLSWRRQGDEVASGLAIPPEGGAPGKVFLVAQTFDQQRAEDHLALIQALARSAARCDVAEARPEMAEILSRPGYLGMTLRGLTECLKSGGLKAHRFHGAEVNRPTLEKASWLLHQMDRASLMEGRDHRDLRPSVEEIFRSELYDEATVEAAE